jgi:integrase/recombinase XerD
MATDFVEKFRRHLKEDGKSQKTIESYVGDIAGFVAYMENMGVKFQGELKRFYVTSFRNHLIESQYGTATINKKINSIQSFNVFLMRNRHTSEIVVDLRKDRMKVAFGSEKQVEVFSEKQVERMLFYIQNEDKVSKRDRMIILLLMYTGVRVSELCDIRMRVSECVNLTVECVDFKNNVILVRSGKGNKDRSIPINGKLRALLMDYVEGWRNEKNTDRLFCTKSGGICPSYINRKLKVYAKEAGIAKHLTAHILRHSFASNLLKNGVDILRIQKLLGHASIKTTSIYTHTNIVDLGQAVNAL